MEAFLPTGKSGKHTIGDVYSREFAGGNLRQGGGTVMPQIGGKEKKRQEGVGSGTRTSPTQLHRSGMV
jgi:hypothetical protein